MTIGKRNILGYVTLGTAVAFAGLYAAKALEAQLTSIGNFHGPALQRIQKIETDFEKAGKHVYEYMLTNSTTEKQHFWALVNSLNTQANRYRISAQLDESGDDQKRVLLEKIAQGQQVWLEKAKAMFAEHQLRGFAGMNTLQEYRKAFHTAEHHTAELVKIQAQEATRAQGQAYALINKSLWHFYGIALISVIAAAQIGFLISRSITKPIQALKDAATEMGKGQLDTRVQVNSQDEIRVLARSFNQMADKLQQSYDNIEEKVQQRTEELEQKKQLLEKEIADRLKAEALARQHQDELAHVARLGTMGEMASVLAHELNQPLCAIVTSAQACLRLLACNSENPDDILDGLIQIAQQGQRAGKIIGHMRGFVSQQKPERSPVNIDAVISEAIDISAHLARQDGIDIKVELEAAETTVEVDLIQIEQVVLNLVRNAIEAIVESNQSHNELTVKTSVLADQTVQISISDSGVGLPCEDIEQIFDSFYTTKQKGMGIGLSLSRSIIEKHGGYLWATRNPNQGSTFHFTLPVCCGDTAHAL